MEDETAEGSDEGLIEHDDYDLGPAFEALHEFNDNMPELLSFNVITSFSIEGTTESDELIHLLCDVEEPSGHYRYGLATSRGAHADMLLLAGSEGQIGFGRVFTDSGDVTEIGPGRGWTGTAEWLRLGAGMAVSVLTRRNRSRQPGKDHGRVRADSHEALNDFLAHGGRIAVRSWRVAHAGWFPGVAGARIEVWGGIVAAGVISYAAVAAAYARTGPLPLWRPSRACRQRTIWHSSACSRQTERTSIWGQLPSSRTSLRPRRRSCRPTCRTVSLRRNSSSGEFEQRDDARGLRLVLGERWRGGGHLGV